MQAIVVFLPFAIAFQIINSLENQHLKREELYIVGGGGGFVAHIYVECIIG